MNSERIRSILNSPKEPGLELIANPSEYEKEVLEGYHMERVNYGFELDRFCPAKLGQLTVIVGHTNVGKTTTILWLLSMLLKQDRKILIYSAENRISVIHKQLIRFATGHEVITMPMLDAFRDQIRYIKHERHYSYKDMLNQATYLLDANFEFDFFLVDPYNSLRIDNKERLNTHDYHYQAAEEMRIFTNNSNKSIFLNCHTVTEAQRVKPDANGHRPAPMDSDVEGGGKFPNKADDTIVIHRQISSMIEGEKYISEIHVRKVRNQEFGGEPTPFDRPVKIKYRINRTGFETVGSYESKIHDYKQLKMKEDKPF
jgi:energy-coupling factor transporter ATP-binding protein EcfA2